MELRHLRYFVAVAQALNFTRAAEKLHTSQPSLSSQIRDLENCVGVPLLVRDKRKDNDFCHHAQRPQIAHRRGRVASCLPVNGAKTVIGRMCPLQ